MIYDLSHRAPRSTFELTRESGVYAIFLQPNATLPSLVRRRDGILYVGRTQAESGFAGRDHFSTSFTSSTVRQSLAVLLETELGLNAVAARRTWSLDAQSDDKLKAWMQQHLLLAVEPRSDAPLYEQRMIWEYQPPFNLKDCIQTEAHEKLSALRRDMQLRCRQSDPHDRLEKFVLPRRLNRQ